MIGQVAVVQRIVANEFEGFRGDVEGFVHLVSSDGDVERADLVDDATAFDDGFGADQNERDAFHVVGHAGVQNALGRDAVGLQFISHLLAALVRLGFGDEHRESGELRCVSKQSENDAGIRVSHDHATVDDELLTVLGDELPRGERPSKEDLTAIGEFPVAIIEPVRVELGQSDEPEK